MVKNLLLSWKQLSAAGRVLVLNGLTFNLGFYMLLPYLAGHLQNTVGLGGWAIGLVLGARVFCQQGLFLIGGTLGDYLGYRAVILAGCAIRSVGFVLLGFGESLPLLLLGAGLAGFAGALFTPCSQAYLALEYPDAKQRHEVFSLQNLFSEAGMLLGPLVGLALLGIDFALIGLLSGGFFLLLLLLQWKYLPSHSHNQQITEESQQTTAENQATSNTAVLNTIVSNTMVLKQWWSMLCQTSFMRFVLFASVYQLLFHQLYLAIPTSAKIATGDDSLITWIFSLSSILGILLQLPISSLAAKFQPHRSMALGMLLMGSAYLALIIDPIIHAFFPYLLCAALLSIGSLFVFPLLGAQIPHYAKDIEMGRYYGLYACVGGVVASLGNIVIGFVLPDMTIDQQDAQSQNESISHLLWLGLFLAGAIAAIGLYFVSKPSLKKASYEKAPL